MFILGIRAVLIYLLVLLVFRLMGKRQLGQMQPFELVLTLIIADLATIPMAELTVPIFHGIVPLLTLVTIHFALTFLSQASQFLSRVISGKPTIVVNPDGVDYKTMKKLNISIDDIFEAIRGCGYFSLDEVQYAIVETGGKVHVLPKKEFDEVKNRDLHAKQTEENELPVTIISEGKIMKQNVKVSEIQPDSFCKWLLKETKCKNIKDVLICTLDRNNKVYFQKKNEAFKVLSYRRSE